MAHHYKIFFSRCELHTIDLLKYWFQSVVICHKNIYEKKSFNLTYMKRKVLIIRQKFVTNKSLWPSDPQLLCSAVCTSLPAVIKANVLWLIYEIDILLFKLLKSILKKEGLFLKYTLMWMNLLRYIWRPKLTALIKWLLLVRIKRLILPRRHLKDHCYCGCPWAAMIVYHQVRFLAYLPPLP